MEHNTIPDYWIDDAGGGSDCELRCALESFCDVPSPASGSGVKEVHRNGCGLEQIGSLKRKVKSSKDRSRMATKQRRMQSLVEVAKSNNHEGAETSTHAISTPAKQRIQT